MICLTKPQPRDRKLILSRGIRRRSSRRCILEVDAISGDRGNTSQRMGQKRDIPNEGECHYDLTRDKAQVRATAPGWQAQCQTSTVDDDILLLPWLRIRCGRMASCLLSARQPSWKTNRRQRRQLQLSKEEDCRDRRKAT